MFAVCVRETYGHVCGGDISVSLCETTPPLDRESGDWVTTRATKVISTSATKVTEGFLTKFVLDVDGRCHHSTMTEIKAMFSWSKCSPSPLVCRCWRVW